MAKITKVFASGKLGNLVFYEAMGKAVVRTHPDQVKQTPGMVNQSRLFGQSKKISRALRQGFAAIPGFINSKPLMYRVDAAVKEWLKSNQQQTGIIGGELSRMELNPPAAFRSLFRTSATVEWTNPGFPVLSLTGLIATRDIIAPPGTSEIELTISVTGCRITDCVTLPNAYCAITIPYTGEIQPRQDLRIEHRMAPGSIFVLVTGLRFHEEGKIAGSNWQPHCIQSAFYLAEA